MRKFFIAAAFGAAAVTHATAAHASYIDTTTISAPSSRAERPVLVADLIGAIVAPCSCTSGPLNILISNSYRARSTMGGF